MEIETLFISVVSNQQFSPGQTVMTDGVQELVQQGIFNPSECLRRHLSGDWGDVDKHDWHRNDVALKSACRLLSAYKITPEVKIWIITEWDRSVTTLLLPSEY